MINTEKIIVVSEETTHDHGRVEFVTIDKEEVGVNLSARLVIPTEDQDSFLEKLTNLFRQFAV